MTEPVHLTGRSICSYEGTSYRADFWEGHGREYEDLAERIALRRLLPPRGRRLLEVGAGYGRLADLYNGYEQLVLLDYAKSGLREAQARLGRSARILLVAADLYRMPIAPGTCDTVVTVRVLHHVTDLQCALCGLAASLRPGGTYVLEFANKRNLKAIGRYWLGRQRWSPFDEQPFEFARLNYDFHPRWMARELARAGFRIEAGRAVSYFRAEPLKRCLPPGILGAFDAVLQVPGAACKLAPSIFLRCRLPETAQVAPIALFQCPQCRGQDWRETERALACQRCGAVWAIDDGIYDFKAPAA